MNVAEAKKDIEEGHFAKGSMLPKIQAIVRVSGSRRKRSNSY